MATIIATRIYPFGHFECRDILTRKDGTFTLTYTTNGRPDREVTFSISQAWHWMQDCPWQIKRAIC